MFVPTLSRAQTWAGKWVTSVDGEVILKLEIHQTGISIGGNYGGDDNLKDGTIEGKVTGRTLTGRWANISKDGAGTFIWELSVDGMSFTGTYLRTNDAHTYKWNGTRVNEEPSPDYEMQVRIDASYALFSNQLQTGGKTCESVGVECVGSDVSCSNSALNMASQALEFTNIKKSFWQAVSQTIKIGKDIITGMFPELESPAEVVELIRIYLESDTWEDLCRSLGEHAAGKGGEAITGDDFWSQQLGQYLGEFIYNGLVPEGEPNYVTETYNHAGCGRLVVTYMMRPIENGYLRMTFGASGDCECKWPNFPRGLGKWFVLGGVDLSPMVSLEGNTILITYSPGPANYKVEADCTCRQND